MTTYEPASIPTLYFVGVTTGGSSIMRVFPLWAEALELGECRIVGIDVPIHADPEAYRAVVRFIKADPLSLGALVTTHKIDLFAAARDLFDDIEPMAEAMGELSCLSKRDGRLLASAKDPISSGLALEAFLPPDHFARTGAELFCMGAGGSTIAITWYLMRRDRQANRPARVVVSNRSQPRLRAIERLHREFDAGVPVDYVWAPNPTDNDALMAKLPPGSLVVNATGLGKDAPGSPITDAAGFPDRGLAWDLNYRGDLVFLDQANRQAAAKGLQVEDGWIYFVYGWTQVIAEVFGVTIPSSGPVIDRLSDLAGGARGSTP